MGIRGGLGERSIQLKQIRTPWENNKGRGNLQDDTGKITKGKVTLHGMAQNRSLREMQNALWKNGRDCRNF